MNEKDYGPTGVRPSAGRVGRMTFKQWRLVKRSQRTWFRNAYAKDRAKGGGRFNSLGHAWFSTRTIKAKRP